MRIPRSTTSVFRALAGAALLLSAAVVLPATSASAAAPATGWIRLAHLSPDTPAIDVSLTALGATGTRVALKDVAYGDVSGYQRVPAGTYAASMVPAGAKAGTTPVLTKTLEVGAGGAFTVAAVGRNANLTSTVLVDDLTPPAQGEAKVRLLQASAAVPKVDVSARGGGPVVAAGANFGSATGYATIPAGAWDLDVSATGGAGKQTDRVDLPGGSVNTLFVLDGAGGKLQVKAVSDSSGLATMPTGGVQTGGGGLAAGTGGAGSSGGATTPLALLTTVLLGAAALVARSARSARAAGVARAAEAAGPVHETEAVGSVRAAEAAGAARAPHRPVAVAAEVTSA